MRGVEDSHVIPRGVRPTLLRALTLMTGNVAADSNEQLPETASLQQEECPYHAAVAAGEPCIAKLFVFMGPHLKSCLFFSLFLAPVAAINYAEFSVSSNKGELCVLFLQLLRHVPGD